MKDQDPSFIPRLRVFLAEDDREMRQMIAVTLRRDGHFVLEAADGPSLLRDLGHVFWGEGSDSAASLIITDVRMPGRDGLAILRGLRHYRWCPPFIVVTAFGDPETHQEARRLGATAVFDKPFDLDRLRIEVENVARAIQVVA
jgi:DNA-binding response OmpR family regulator